MKEETQAILFGLGMIIFSTSMLFILKKFFEMTTSGAVVGVIIWIGILFLIALLTVEYVAYKEREGKRGLKKLI